MTVSSASSAAFGAGESGGEEGKDDDVGGVDLVEASDDVDEAEVFGRDGGNETAAALGDDDDDDDDDDAALGVRYGCDETLRGWRNEGYRGCQSKTRSGRTCQSWDRQWPHKHSRRKCHKGSCGNNYCRNPDGEPTIWCYTTDSRKPVGELQSVAETGALPGQVEFVHVVRLRVWERTKIQDVQCDQKRQIWRQIVPLSQRLQKLCKLHHIVCCPDGVHR